MILSYRIFRFLSMALLLALLNACTFPPRIYRMDVRQGNYLSSQTLAALKLGMEKSAVIEVMGTPALDHFFEQDRWDYYYHLKPGRSAEPIQEKHLTVFFKGGKLIRIVHDHAAPL